MHLKLLRINNPTRFGGRRGDKVELKMLEYDICENDIEENIESSFYDHGTYSAKVECISRYRKFGICQIYTFTDFVNSREGIHIYIDTSVYFKDSNKMENDIYYPFVVNFLRNEMIDDILNKNK